MSEERGSFINALGNFLLGGPDPRVVAYLRQSPQERAEQERKARESENRRRREAKERRQRVNEAYGRLTQGQATDSDKALLLDALGRLRASRDSARSQASFAYSQHIGNLAAGRIDTLAASRTSAAKALYEAREARYQGAREALRPYFPPPPGTTRR